MKLLNKIEKINEDIDNLNETINNLLIEQSPNPIINFLWRRKLRKFFFGDDEEEDDESLRDKFDKFEDEVDEWSESGQKEQDIEDTIDDVKEKTGLDDKEKEEEFRQMLNDIADKQKELIDSLIRTKGFDEIRVSFGQPIEFDIRYGKSKGEELKLEGGKKFDVYDVVKKFGKTTIYFNYKTKKENWLKDKNIMFSLTMKDPKTDHKYDSTTIKIVYVEDTALRSGEIKIIDEKVLTHRAKVEIKSFK